MLDSGKQAHIDLAQSPQRAAALGMDEIQERGGFFIAFAGTSSFKSHELTETIIFSTRTQLFHTDSEAIQIFARKINPAEQSIFANVAKDVC